MGNSSKKPDEDLDLGVPVLVDPKAETLRCGMAGDGNGGCIPRDEEVGGPAEANGDCRGLSDRLLLLGGGATDVVVWTGCGT
jgi:hypothetical protein